MIIFAVLYKIFINMINNCAHKCGRFLQKENYARLMAIFKLVVC